MTDKKSKMNEGKRLSKGLRKHIRRLKQEAIKEGTVYRSPTIKRRPSKKSRGIVSDEHTYSAASGILCCK